jgi:hypothetical protein
LHKEEKWGARPKGPYALNTNAFVNRRLFFLLSWTLCDIRPSAVSELSSTHVYIRPTDLAKQTWNRNTNPNFFVWEFRRATYKTWLISGNSGTIIGYPKYPNFYSYVLMSLLIINYVFIIMFECAWLVILYFLSMYIIIQTMFLY